uniref:Uncharacterized protein n=1 Tax=Panagrolaimus davidi TaxID=227884 RepID=A0A914P488_9BILA
MSNKNLTEIQAKTPSIAPKDRTPSLSCHTSGMSNNKNPLEIEHKVVKKRSVVPAIVYARRCKKKLLNNEQFQTSCV